jgi:hypothetical protein
MESIKPALSGRVKAPRLDNPHSEQASRGERAAFPHAAKEVGTGAT